MSKELRYRTAFPISNGMNNNPKYIAVLAALVVGCVALIGGLWWLSQPKTASSPADVVAFAQCLATKKVTMYGAYWCQHCQNQKALFGDAFKYVPYVECTENTKLCADKGVEGFPTWFAPDGKGGEAKLVGEQSFADLAKASGCPAPTSK